jgi:PAS domain S-box-containing protein
VIPRPPLTAPLAEQLLSACLDGVLAYDRDYRILYWNPAMERMTGMRAEDVVGQGTFELFPFLVAIGEDRAMRAALAGDSTVSSDRPFEVPGTGRRGVFEGHYSPLHDHGGRAIIGGIAVLRDITHRKRTEEQVGETESRFRNMADVSPVMLWMSETDGMCTFFNQTWLDFTGRSLAEEWGVGWAENVHFEDFQRCMDTYLEAFQARRVFEMEYRLRRKDGSFRWILDRGTPRYTPDGTFAGYIGSCIDITERRQLEVDLRAAVRVRDDFLSVASHELRTPITAMQLQADTLALMLRRRAEEALASGKLGESVAAVGSQIARLGELVEALLDVSRITSGRLELRVEEGVALGELVEEVVERWQQMASAAGSSVSAQVVDRAGDLVGRWDRVRLEQVLNNLLSNAVKYGRGRPIVLRVLREAERAVVEVQDQGIGVAEGDHQRIFERWGRGDASKNYGGLGLGLWIAAQIVSAMEGSITLVSAPGHGATFRVALPLGEPSSLRPREESAAQ